MSFRGGVDVRPYFWGMLSPHRGQSTPPTRSTQPTKSSLPRDPSGREGKTRFRRWSRWSRLGRCLASGVSPDPRRQTPDEKERPPGRPGGLPFVGVGPLRATALQEHAKAEQAHEGDGGPPPGNHGRSSCVWRLASRQTRGARRQTKRKDRRVSRRSSVCWSWLRLRLPALQEHAQAEEAHEGDRGLGDGGDSTPPKRKTRQMCQSLPNCQ